MLASEVMDNAAALCNDVNKQLYTYAAQLPYLRLALEDITLEMEDNKIPTIKETSSILSVPAGTTLITTATTPAIPSDLRDPVSLEERPSGSSNNFIPMFLREIPEEDQQETLRWWDWRENEIKLLGATADIDLKINYLKGLAAINSENSVIVDMRLLNPLAYLTAAKLCRYIGENFQRSNDLLRDFRKAMDHYIGVNVKKDQANPVRRPGYRER